MNNKKFKNYLVTTALDFNNKKIKNNRYIIIGDWCLTFDRRKLSNDKNKLLKYHWDDRSKIINDFKLINKIYEKILEVLVSELNLYHKANFSKRYWRIIIGPWLGSILVILFDRWTCLKDAKKNYQNLYLKVSNFNIEKIIPQDTKDFYSKMTSDLWNKYIFELIAKEININIEIKDEIYIKANSEKVYKKKAKQFKKNLLDNFKYAIQKTKKFIIKISIFLVSISRNKKNQIIFFDVSLDFISKLKLALSDKRILFVNNFSFQDSVDQDIDFRFRKKVLSKLEVKEIEKSFITFLSKTIPLMIPKIFLENYKNFNYFSYGILKKTNITSLLTQTGIYQNEKLKILAAYLSETGTKIYISQHGGHYGLGLYSFFEDHEYSISDYFLSWGWDLKTRDKVVPFGSLNLLNKRKFNKFSKRGNGILLVLMSLPRYSYNLYSATISSSQVRNYHFDQFRFASSLEKKLLKILKVRFYSEDFGFNIKKEWEKRFPSIEFDDNKKNIFQLFKKYKVFICTYNATTLLEMLHVNVPTIIFFDKNNWEIRNSFKIYINLLKENKILHETPELAASFLKENYNLIDDWWYSDKVQSARSIFCEKFAYVPNDPLKKISNILL